MTDVCAYCGEKGHVIKACPIFARLKRKCSTIDYVDRKLNERDVAGCAAAGFLIYSLHSESKQPVLYVLKETRGDVTAFTFPGGKRNDATESPLDIARRELAEETGVKLQFASHGVMWFAAGKYALHIARVKWQARVNNLERVHVDSLNREQWHPYAWNMLMVAHQFGIV